MSRSFFFVRRETSILLVAALVVLLRIDTRHSKSSTDNRKWSQMVASRATAFGKKRLEREFPGCEIKEAQQCCAARRSRAAGSSRRTAATVRPVGPAVAKRERRYRAAHARQLGRPHRRCCNGNGAVCAGTIATVPIAATILAAAAATAVDAAGNPNPGGPILARGIWRGSQPRL